MALRAPIRVFHRSGTNNCPPYCVYSQLDLIFQFEDKAFRVVVDTYVTNADGTGIVHQAPAFGEDDHRIAIAHGVLQPEDMPPCPIDDRGHFTQEVPDFVGLHVKVKTFHFIRP
jgi:isoleucyl-tRNA synthetase